LKSRSIASIQRLRRCLRRRRIKALVVDAGGDYSIGVAGARFSDHAFVCTHATFISTYASLFAAWRSPQLLSRAAGLIVWCLGVGQRAGVGGHYIGVTGARPAVHAFASAHASSACGSFGSSANLGKNVALLIFFRSPLFPVLHGTYTPVSALHTSLTQ
jgi:hypothetical protein